MTETVGSHISIGKNLYATILTYHSVGNKPFQIFTGNPRTGIRNYPKNSKEISEYIVENNMKLYIHSSYIVNLCNDKLSDYIDKEYLIGESLSAKGVVYHVGKYLNNDIKDSVEAMKSNIHNILEDNKESNVKFLLETPAGQKSELLTDIDDFINFCKEFKCSNFGVVIDTCHVFASGYDPLEYLQKVYNSGISIDLVHLNDSKTRLNSRVDRHERIGEGFIGLKKLTECIEFCKKYGIDMVNE